MSSSFDFIFCLNIKLYFWIIDLDGSIFKDMFETGSNYIQETDSNTGIGI